MRFRRNHFSFFVFCLVTINNIVAGAISFQKIKKEAQLLPFEEQEALLPVVDQSPIDMSLLEGIDSLLGAKKTCAYKTVLEVYRSRSAIGDTTQSDRTWLENSGVIASYQLQLSESPCLSVLYYEFYNKIQKDEELATSSFRDKKDSVNNRPALNANAGEGSYKEVAPNQYYDQAMELTQGDPQLALEMIGYCGHDDQNQNAPVKVNLDSGNSREDLLLYMKRSAAADEKLVGNNLAESMFNITHQEEIERLKTRDIASLNIKCPSTHSFFYAPAAVHSDLRLEDKLIDEIASIQAPNKGANVLPAKNYHMTFAATMGCRLSQCGLDEEDSAKFLQYLAKKYRQKRLNDSQKKYKKWQGLIIREFGFKDWSDPKIATPEFANDVNDWIERDYEKIKKIVGEELFTSNRTKINWSFLRKHIDASQFYANYLSNSYLESEEKYNSAQKSGMSYCLELLKDQTRCNDAWKTMKTWMIDFKWTSAQQGKGARFGNQQCRETQQYDRKSMEERACNILKNRHQEYRCAFSLDGKL